MKILIADDDPQFLKALKITLHSQGYEIVTARDGVECITVAVREHPDLFMIDLGMPKMDGMGVIQGVRGWTEAPILVVSGRTNEREKVAVLDAGADDYVTKPVPIDELLARIRALLRRTRKEDSDAPSSTLTFGDVTVDLAAHAVFRGRKGRQVRVRLTPTEWKVLEALARNAGRLVTRQDLLTEIWGAQHVRDTGYLRLYISQLRKKIESDPSHPRYLKTEPGMGYRLDVDEPEH
ncbi:response regulator transcription factor [Bifidobacterium tissieri]|uniref:Response regulator transcription factor n=1 Tax=Bifidobacterium tissieri TaxID=1630162 RepID=A0A5M9ZMT9_9BIFI|nr:response regulator transcription factor [Bifidobacterium tissieri]KAA8828805.1 response regulator transcription factor [Bifidobacterium tissieri]KAA8831675.1 response regulator transcription factor [Bifidobacterium tissieri]